MKTLITLTSTFFVLLVVQTCFGATHSITITDNAPEATGINETSLPTNGLTFQNPFSDQLRIYGNQAGSVSVFDVSGGKIADVRLENTAPSAEINTGNLSDGVYFISFSDNGKVLQTYKAIKEN